MNKIVIVSDSHGLTKELEVIKQRHEADLFLHCGDSELQEDNDALIGYTTVKGNCDVQANFPNDQMIEIGGLNVFITHGHLYDVKSSLLHVTYKAKEAGADIVCFGHSHVAYAEQIDHQLLINPGSIRLPRKFPAPSYCVLEWSNKANIKVSFIQPTGEVITDFPYENQMNLKEY